MMSNLPELIFSPKASRDIDDILHYTLLHWGQKQADKYADKLSNAFQILRGNPYIGSMCKEFRPGYRSFQVEKHVIIYLPDEETINIIRIVHASRDIALLTN